jgi:glycosyltransferase involved in cell wall biosynthesis
VHVAISAHLGQELELRRAIQARVMFNSLAMDELQGGDRAGTRRRLGLSEDDLVLLHPVTPYPRKNVEAAARFADAVATPWLGRVVYWLTGGAADPLGGQGKYHFLAGRSGSKADLYAAADAVLLTSSWEGWGNPVAEAATLGLPVVTGTWPALEEMRALGVRDIPVAAPDAVERLLHALAQGAGHRVLALRSALDRSRLPAELASLLGRA